MPSGLPHQASHLTFHNKNKHPFGQPKQRTSLKLQLAETMEGNNHNLKLVGGPQERDDGIQGQQTTC